MKTPEGFSITREENKNPFCMVEYTISVTTYIKIAIPEQADSDEQYRAASLNYGLQELALGTMRVCGAIL